MYVESHCTPRHRRRTDCVQDARNAALADKEGLNGAGSGFAPNDHAAAAQRQGWGPYGGNPLAHIATNDSNLNMAAFGGAFQPGTMTTTVSQTFH